LLPRGGTKRIELETVEKLFFEDDRGNILWEVDPRTWPKERA